MENVEFNSPGFSRLSKHSVNKFLTKNHTQSYKQQPTKEDKSHCEGSSLVEMFLALVATRGFLKKEVPEIFFVRSCKIEQKRKLTTFKAAIGFI